MITTHTAYSAGSVPIWGDIAVLLAIVHLIIMIAALITLADTPTLTDRTRHRWTLLAIICPCGGTGFLAHRYIYDDLYRRHHHITHDRHDRRAHPTRELVD